MKKNVLQGKKLVLAKESIRVLDEGCAKEVAGGLTPVVFVAIGFTIAAVSDAYC